MGRRSKSDRLLRVVGFILIGVVYVIYGAILAAATITRYFWGRSTKGRELPTTESDLHGDQQDQSTSKAVRRDQMDGMMWRTIQLGPINFTLVDTGIDVSVNLAGMNIALAPRGNYVKMGLGQLSYGRTTTGSTTDDSSLVHPEEVSRGQSTEQAFTTSSASRSRLIHTTSAQVLKEILVKSQRRNLHPIVAGFGLVLVVALFAISAPTWGLIVAFVLGMIATFAAYLNDVFRTSVILMYDIDDGLRAAYRNLCQDLLALRLCDQAWHFPQPGSSTVTETAGRSRNAVQFTFDAPDFISTNIDVPIISFATTKLMFFPDRLFVSKNGQIMSVDYDQLQLEYTKIELEEHGAVPKDAVILRTRWTHQNKDGSPDRRFNSNPAIPTCQYEGLLLKGPKQLLETLILSRTGFGAPLKAELATFTNVLTTAKMAETLRRQQENQLQAVLAAQEPREQSHAKGTAIDAAAVDSAGDLPEVESLDAAMLHVLCCVMVADGKASRAERVYIHQQLRKLEIAWDTKTTESQINVFVEHVKIYGGKQVLQRTVAHIPQIKQSGKSHVLLDCLNGLIVSDENVDDRELALCGKLSRLLE